MAWIKRNLYFVIIVVVGLGLTGYCGYLLSAALSQNATAMASFSDATNNLIQLQNSKPFPSPENIKASEADADRVKAFKGEFLKAFSGFPTPPKLDDRQFHDYLNKTIFQFGAAATNAGVSMNAGYSFGFALQLQPYNFPAECIGPWMQELEEMNAILHILYSAKINYLEHLHRPLVADTDTSEDSFQFKTSTNANGVVTPYKLEFRAFSGEIANVLAGFAASSNCFIVKAPLIEKSMAQLPDVPQPAPPPVEPLRTFRQTRPFNPDEPFAGRSRGDPSDRSRMQRMAPPPQQVQVSPTPAAPTVPVTILRERPIFVTLYIDVVKLKALETNSPSNAPRARTGTVVR
jgi:hypothetical protein